MLVREIGLAMKTLLAAPFTVAKLTRLLNDNAGSNASSRRLEAYEKLLLIRISGTCALGNIFLAICGTVLGGTTADRPTTTAKLTDRQIRGSAG